MRAAEFTDTLLVRGRIAVCVGCGGVGKTTVAAALALEAARRGRRALVLTIDPARRLADALGVEALGNQPQPLERDALHALGVREPGELSAMMLDMKRHLRRSRGPLRRERARRASASSGNPHLPARLGRRWRAASSTRRWRRSTRCRQRDEYDLIVVDTPPAQHALDFLEAPQRLIEFLDSRIVQMLIHPAFAAGRFGFRLFQRGDAARPARSSSGSRASASWRTSRSSCWPSRACRRASASARCTCGRCCWGPRPPSCWSRDPARSRCGRRCSFASGSRATGVAAGGRAGQPRAPLARRRAGLRRSRRGSEAASADLAALAAALGDACGAELPAAEAAPGGAGRREGIRCAGAARRSATAEAARARGGGSGASGAQIPELPDDVHDLEGLAQIARAICASSEGSDRRWRRNLRAARRHAAKRRSARQRSRRRSPAPGNTAGRRWPRR